MDIRIYNGGHQATTEHFTAALAENNSVLKDAGIIFFPTENDTFHNIFTTSKAIRNGKNPEAEQKNLLHKLTGVTDAKRLLIIDNRIIGQEHRLFNKEPFTPRPRNFIKQIQTIFPGLDIRLFVETRNISTLVAAYYKDTIFNNKPIALKDFLSELDIENLKWSTYINRAQGKGTPLPATVWQYENYPLIWRDIIGAITGIPMYQNLIQPGQDMDLDVDLETALLLYKYTQKHPIRSREKFEKLKSVFLEKQLQRPKVSIDPEWSKERIQALEYSYDDDWYYIERMDDIEAIAPRVLL